MQLLQELESAKAVNVCPDSWGYISVKGEQIDTETYTLFIDISGFVTNYNEVSPYHSRDPRYEDNTSIDTKIYNIVTFDDNGEVFLPGEDIEKIADYINNNLINIEL